MRMCRGKTRNFYEYGKAALDSSGNNNKLTNFKQKRWQSEKKRRAELQTMELGWVKMLLELSNDYITKTLFEKKLFLKKNSGCTD